jgi:hypothetical protein
MLWRIAGLRDLDRESRATRVVMALVRFLRSPLCDEGGCEVSWRGVMWAVHTPGAGPYRRATRL